MLLTIATNIAAAVRSCSDLINELPHGAHTIAMRCVSYIIAATPSHPPPDPPLPHSGPVLELWPLSACESKALKGILKAF